MNLTERNLQDYIPYYLTQDKKIALDKAIKNFPNTNYYSTQLIDGLLQGDCWTSLEVYHPLTHEKKQTPAILLSNSCDMDSSNRRDTPTLINFAPIIKLNDYVDRLQKGGISQEKIDQKIEHIRTQFITSIFYLPSNITLKEEHIALLDNIHTIRLDKFAAIQEKERICTLSQIGFYIFVFKLSVHFCRFHEAIDRD